MDWRCCPLEQDQETPPNYRCKRSRCRPQLGGGRSPNLALGRGRRRSPARGFPARPRRRFLPPSTWRRSRGLPTRSDGRARPRHGRRASRRAVAADPRSGSDVGPARFRPATRTSGRRTADSGLPARRSSSTPDESALALSAGAAPRRRRDPAGRRSSASERARSLCCRATRPRHVLRARAAGTGRARHGRGA